MDYDLEGEDDDYGDEGWEAGHQAQQHEQMKLYQAFKNAQRPSFTSLVNRCMRPVLLGENSVQLAELIVLCLILNIVTCLRFMPRFVTWAVSSILGILFLFRWYGVELTLYLVLFAIVAYVLLTMSCKPFDSTNKNASPKNASLVALFCVVFSVLLHILVLGPKKFTRIRGSLMVMAMKVISLSIDLLPPGSSDMFPNVLEYVSYLFNVATVNFGPWYSFQQHQSYTSHNRFKPVIAYLIKGFLLVGCSFACLLISSCFLDWLIMNEYAYYSETIVRYKEATSFRFSHYFVSYFSEATVLLSGCMLFAKKLNLEDHTNKFSFKSLFEFHVTNMWKIELPRSITEVVVYWNMPMHYWLKTYVFKPCFKYGTLIAILLTYAASSALHGFNFQVSIVLLSLGFYSYGEYVLRKKLAKSFDACIAARKCQKCEHKYKNWNVFVILVNFGFVAVSIYHLIYLGMLFDYSEDQEKGYSALHVWNKWQESGFGSLYVGLAFFLLAIMV